MEGGGGGGGGGVAAICATPTQVSVLNLAGTVRCLTDDPDPIARLRRRRRPPTDVESAAVLSKPGLVGLSFSCPAQTQDPLDPV